MPVVADLGDSNNPLRFLFWYEFACFVVALSLMFTSLIALFGYFA